MNRKLSSWLTRTAVLGLVAAGCGPVERGSAFEPSPNSSPRLSEDVLQQSDSQDAGSLEDALSLSEDKHSSSIDISMKKEVFQPSINFYSPQKPFESLKNILPTTNNLEANCETNSDCPANAACENGMCWIYDNSKFTLNKNKTDSPCITNEECWDLLGTDFFCEDNYCTTFTISSEDEPSWLEMNCDCFIDSVYHFTLSDSYNIDYKGSADSSLQDNLECQKYNYECNVNNFSDSNPDKVVGALCKTGGIFGAILQVLKKGSGFGLISTILCSAYELASYLDTGEEELIEELGTQVNLSESELLECKVDCLGKYGTNPNGWGINYSFNCAYPSKIVMVNYEPQIKSDDITLISNNPTYIAEIKLTATDDLTAYGTPEGDLTCSLKQIKPAEKYFGTQKCIVPFTYVTADVGEFKLLATPKDTGAMVFTFFNPPQLAEDGSWITSNEPDYSKSPTPGFDQTKTAQGENHLINGNAEIDTPVPCTNYCDFGTTTCFGAGYVICLDTDGDGCLEWGSLQLCPAGTSCKTKSGECEADAPVCIDDCVKSGEQECVGNGWRKCGYYDDDPCLEWSVITSCKATETCSGGSCEENILECTCTEWQWAIEYGCGKNGCECDERYQTRDCTPSGCEIESLCTLKESCISTCSPELKSIDLYPIQDTFVTSKYNEEILLDEDDLGWEDVLWVGMREVGGTGTKPAICRIYLQYDLSPIKNASEIQQALVDIVDDGYSIDTVDSCGWSGSSSEFAYEFIPVSSGWSEKTLVWDNQPDFSAPSLEQPIKLKSYNGFTGFTQKKADLTEMIKYWQTSENKGLVLKVKDEDVFSDSCQFAFEYDSKEAIPNNSFKLTVYYFE